MLKNRTARVSSLALVLGVLSAIGMGSSPAQAASPLCGAAGASGSSTITTTDAAVHTYYYRIAPKAAPATGRPVLIWLHGDGGTGSSKGSTFWSSTDPDGAIIVTPNGTNKTWEHRAGDTVDHPLDSQFLSKIIDELQTCASVNTSKIFVGGASRGAYMPYFLLQRASTRNRIAGIAVNAGLLYCQAGDGECEAGDFSATLHSSAARIIHLHGTNDTSVTPVPTAAFHNPINWGVDYRVFNPMKLWAHQHGCFDGSSISADSGSAVETYKVGDHLAHVYNLTRHGAACSKYQLILVTNGGHVIKGQEARIWAFLMNRVLCAGKKATIVGTNGKNTLYGTSHNDVIAGLNGNDIIKGGGGNDTICGGDGNDTVNGGSGTDWLYGDYGDDTLQAKDSTKDQRIDGGSGKDTTSRDSGDPKPVSVP